MRNGTGCCEALAAWSMQNLPNRAEVGQVLILDPACEVCKAAGACDLIVNASLTWCDEGGTYWSCKLMGDVKILCHVCHFGAIPPLSRT